MVGRLRSSIFSMGARPNFAAFLALRGCFAAIDGMANPFLRSHPGGYGKEPQF